MIVILDNGHAAPVPEGYTVERVIEILRETGLVPVRVKNDDGTYTDLEAKTEAA